MKVVAVILARGGSRRLPGKNIHLLCGKPLIAYTIEAARGAATLARTIVSTDDAAIADCAAAHGAEVPFRRPAELSGDDSPSVAALAHAADWLDRDGAGADAIVLLQPTSPLRRSRHIDAAVELFRSSGADTVTAVVPAPVHPYWCWTPDGADIRPFFSAAHMATLRAELPPALVETGAVYVVRRSLLATGSLYGERVAGYLMDAEDAIDIDTLDDLEYAELVLRRRNAQDKSVQ